MGIAIARAARRIARDMHRRGSFPELKPLLAALCAAGLLAACQSPGAVAANADEASVANARLSPQSSRGNQAPTPQDSEFEQFEGSWVYAQSCGWQHSASFEFTSDDSGNITGMWSEGTQVRGESGKLVGELRGAKLFMRRCRIDAEDNDPVACPNFGDESDYVVREGDHLAWYKRFGKRGYLKSLELQRFVEGREIHKDNDCKEDQ